jgi:uncharacterized protein (TIGR03083 family)
MAGFDDREQARFAQTVALFREVDPAVVLADGSWTARDVLAHLCTVARRYISVPRLAATPREVDAINAEEMSALDGVPVEELLGKFERGFARYREVWGPMGPEHMWPFHGGGQLPTWALRANWLGEMTLHGYDVASAAGVEWSVGDEDAQELLVFLRQIVPVYARPGSSMAVAVAPESGPAWTIRIGAERAETVDGAEDAEATVSGPAWLLVLLLYQRTPPARPSVAGDQGAVERLLASVERP